MRLKLLSIVLFTLFLGGCSVPKDVVYFQGVDSLTPEQVAQMSQTYHTKILPGDMLNITVLHGIQRLQHHLIHQVLLMLKKVNYLFLLLNQCIII